MFYLSVRSTGVQTDLSSPSQKVSYFSNPGYPANDTLLQFATHTIRITDTDICQVRLDMETFELTGPSLTHYPIGECDEDRMVIFTVSPDIGLSGGNQLCGNLTGQHGLYEDDIYCCQ